MAPFVERWYVFTGNGVVVCKTNVGCSLGVSPAVEGAFSKFAQLIG